MEQKINSLKTSSKVISVITKIGYTAMAVMVCICVAMLIFLAVTGGKLSTFTIGKTNVIIFDQLASTPTELAALCSVLIVMGGMFFAIFLLAYRMFNEISLTGEPFTEKYVKAVRAIGILTAAMPFVTGFAELIATLITKTEMDEILSEMPGIVVGAIIFCLSYIIDYGCEIRKKAVTDSEIKTEI